MVRVRPAFWSICSNGFSLPMAFIALLEASAKLQNSLSDFKQKMRVRSASAEMAHFQGDSLLGR
jgi:hypothetical protein